MKSPELFLTAFFLGNVLSSCPQTTAQSRHPKENSRELDGGSIPVPGGKIGEAIKRDLIEVEVSRPETAVWLIQPREALPAWEYALMVGTQNMAIFPFTVLEGINNAEFGAAKKNDKSMKSPRRR